MRNWLLSVLAFALLSTTLSAEPRDDLGVNTGVAMVSAYSAAYKPLKATYPSLELQYNYMLSGRWAITGRYLYALSGTFSGYSGGIMFSSRPSYEEGGELTNSGLREVRVTPKWLFRGAALAGVWSLLGTFNLAQPRLGEKPRAPVSASLYGFAMSGEVLRFVTENAALSLSISDVSALAANFNVNVLCLLFGANYYY